MIAIDEWGVAQRLQSPEQAARYAVRHAVNHGNPHVSARILCHELGIPWERCSRLVSAVTDQQVGHLLLCPDDRVCRLVMRAYEKAELVFARCGSPIEELFLAHGSLRATGWGDDALEFSWGGVSPQYRVGRHRVDFLLQADEHVPVAVELDGHDFHERTKEQASRDKSRDRDLVKAGLRVMRFTGSEVWKNPGECFLEAERVARS